MIKSNVGAVFEVEDAACFMDPSQRHASSQHCCPSVFDLTKGGSAAEGNQDLIPVLVACGIAVLSLYRFYCLSGES